MSKKVQTKEALQAEIVRLRLMQNWTTWQGWIWIGISFIHMLATMVLFGRQIPEGPWKLAYTAAIGVSVLLLDLGIMHYSNVLYKAKEADIAAPGRAKLLYYIAVASEWIFNFTSLYSNRPPAELMPGVMSAALSVLFGSFVTLSILNTGMLVSFIDKIAYQNMAALNTIIQAEQDAADQKKKAAADDQERKDDLRRKNEERRARRQLPGSSPVPENRQLPQVDESTKYQPTAVNVDEKMVVQVDGAAKQVDGRASIWLTMNDNKMSYQQISDSLGGKPGKAYIGLHVKLYREWLAASVSVE